MKLSLAYVTGRANPRFEWFVDSLCSQLFHPTLLSLDGGPLLNVRLDEVQVIFVDGKLWWPGVRIPATQPSMALAHHFYHDPERRFRMEEIVNKRFDFLHLPPLPCTHQGPFRLTSRDFFCASNSRNTAIIAAKHPYLACVDDLSVLTPGWLTQLMHAIEHNYAVCGAYMKVKQLVVEEGLVASKVIFPQGIDSRWEHGSSGGIVPWGGGGFFGCSFGVPTDSALAIDGFEMACCADGGEDYNFGLRLERAGTKIFYNRNMLTYESEEGHHEEAQLPRERRIVTKDRLPPGYDGYEIPNEAEKYFSDHVLLNRIRNEKTRTMPQIPNNLQAIRQDFLATGMVPIPKGPEFDWRDGAALKDL